MPGKKARPLVVRILQVPVDDWILFAEASILMLLWRFVTALAPLRWYTKCLGIPQKDYAAIEMPFSDKVARILLAVRRAKKYSLLPVKCLTEAITAKRMLIRRGIPSALFLGVSHEKNNRKLKAHAWLMYGNQVITGRKGYEKFTVVSVFV